MISHGEARKLQKIFSHTPSASPSNWIFSASHKVILSTRKMPHGWILPPSLPPPKEVWGSEQLCHSQHFPDGAAAVTAPSCEGDRSACREVRRGASKGRARAGWELGMSCHRTHLLQGPPLPWGSWGHIPHSPLCPLTPQAKPPFLGFSSSQSLEGSHPWPHPPQFNPCLPVHFSPESTKPGPQLPGGSPAATEGLAPARELP